MDKNSRTDFLLFSSKSGSDYLFDGATGSVHPWPWQLTETQVSQLYAIKDAHLADLLTSWDMTKELLHYVILWRKQTGAFGKERTTSACSCLEQASCPKEKTPTPSPPPWRPSPAVFGNLMLIVTDSCNLRCEYCLFSGQYQDQGFKQLKPQSMDFKTAQAAVDRFFELNNTPAFRALPDRKLDIAFFGGEPLLEEDLIRQTIGYAQSRKQDHYRLQFSMTTNLTHLSDEFAKFMVENQIGVQCSIDGPRAVHDRYRRTASGKGSFGSLERNLRKLRALDEAYYADFVEATITLNTSSDLLAINEFFESDSVAALPIAFIGFVRDLGSHTDTTSDRRRFREQYRELLKIYLEKKRDGHSLAKGSFLYNYIERPLEIVYERIMRVDSAPGAGPYTGTCQPGRRIAVSTDGHLHLCERINEHFPIGSVQTGLDMQRCDQVYSAYYSALPDCDGCWAKSICTVCFAQVCVDNRFVFSKVHCDGVRNTLKDQLIIMYSLLEEMPGAIASDDPLVDKYQPLKVHHASHL